MEYTFLLITTRTLITSPIECVFDRSRLLYMRDTCFPLSFPCPRRRQEKKRLHEKFGQLCLPGDEGEVRRLILVHEDRMSKKDYPI